MAAVAETIDTVQALTDTGYKWGFETDIEMDVAPKGLSEDTIRMISARKVGARVAAGLAPEGLLRTG